MPPHRPLEARNYDFSFIDRLPYRDHEGYRVYIGDPCRDLPQVGPRLLFVPGAYHGAWCYAHYMEYCMEHGLACAALDLRGHGALRADTGFADTTLLDLAQQVVSAYDILPGPSIVVGHSLGALPAAWCATQRDIAGLVLLAPSPPGNMPGAHALPAKPLGTLCPAPSPDEIRMRFVAADPLRNVAAIAERLNDEAPGVLNDRYLLRIAIDNEKQLAPGLCIEAGLDTHDRHPPGQDHAVATFLGLSHQRLENMPHCMMYADGWETSIQAIESWYRTTFN